VASDGSGSTALRIFVVVIACCVLTLVLVLRGFPYDMLARRLAGEFEATTGTRVAFGALEPKLTIGGPGFEATGVRIQTANGTLFQIDRASLRPAWSLAWLRRSAAVHADVESAGGNLEGVLILGSQPGFSGQLETVDLARLPIENFWPGIELQGILDADVDLATTDAGPEGTLVLHAVEGSVNTADLPMPLPFQTADGELRFGDGSLVEVSRFETTGPLFSADIKGNIGRGASASAAPLDLQVSYKVDPQMSSTLQNIGMKTGRDGSGRIRIRGTPSSPRFE